MSMYGIHMSLCGVCPSRPSGGVLSGFYRGYIATTPLIFTIFWDDEKCAKWPLFITYYLSIDIEIYNIITLYIEIWHKTLKFSLFHNFSKNTCFSLALNCGAIARYHVRQSGGYIWPACDYIIWRYDIVMQSDDCFVLSYDDVICLYNMMMWLCDCGYFAALCLARNTH